MNSSRSLVASAAAGLLLAVGHLAGCAQEPTNTGLSADEVAARYGYVPREDGLTPVFALVPEYQDLTDGYARDLLARECLKGVVEYVAVPPAQLQNPVFDLRTMQPRFNEQIASEYGYPQFRSKGLPAMGVPKDMEITDAVLSEMQACGVEADARLGSPPERLFNDIQAGGWNAIDVDPEVRQAASAWHTCMAPLGLIDLPEEPHGMPPASVLPAAVPDVEPPVTQHERDVAVADARCRVESGFTAAEFRAQVKGELEAIGADIEGFEAARAEYVEYQKGVDAVIAELGG